MIASTNEIWTNAGIRLARAATSALRQLDHWTGARARPGPSSTTGLLGATAEPDAALGPVLARGDAPRLFRELDALDRAISNGDPRELRLSYLPAIGIMETRSPFSPPRRVLLIGMPCLQILTVAELRAALGHEYAHLALRDTEFVNGVVNDLRQRNAKHASGVAGRWALSLAALVCRGMELRADRWSADRFGAMPLRGAIEKIAMAEAVFREAVDLYDPIAMSRGTIYDVFHDAWRHLYERGLETWRARWAANTQVGRFDEHPPLGRRLERLPIRDVTDVSPPALSLIRNSPEFRQVLHNYLFAHHKTPASVFERCRA